MNTENYKYLEELEDFSNLLRHSVDFHIIHDNVPGGHWDCPICTLRDILRDMLLIDVEIK